MSEDRNYPVEILKTKTKDELIELVSLLQEEVAMLDFLIREYEASQESLGKVMGEQLAEHMSSMVLSNTKTGEA